VPPGFEATKPMFRDYALGWEISEYGGAKIISHSGGVFGFICALVFHVMNEIFLSIGVFSYLMSVADTIFFDPDWPRQRR